MKELFPFLIFVAVAAVNIISAMQKKAKENKPAEPSLRRDEIPPELRRRLYGDVDEGIPMARPRGDAPARRIPQTAAAPPPRDQPEPVRAPNVMPTREEVVREQRGDFEDMGTFDPSRPLGETSPYEEAPARRAPAPPPPVPRPRPRPQVPPVMQAPQRRAPQPAQRQPRPPQPVQQWAEPPTPRPAPEPAVAQAAVPQAARVQTSATAPGVAAPLGLAQLFATRDDLRRAILAQEILGTPRSLRAYEYL